MRWGLELSAGRERRPGDARVRGGWQPPFHVSTSPPHVMEVAPLAPRDWPQSIGASSEHLAWLAQNSRLNLNAPCHWDEVVPRGDVTIPRVLCTGCTNTAVLHRA